MAPTHKKPSGLFYAYTEPTGLVTTTAIQSQLVYGENQVGDLPERPYRLPVLGNWAGLVTTVDSATGELLVKYLVVGKASSSSLKDIEKELLVRHDRFKVLYLEGNKKYLPSLYKVEYLPNYIGWVCDGYFFTGKSLYIESDIVYVKPDTITATLTGYDLGLGSKVISIPPTNEIANVRIVTHRSLNHLITKITPETITL